MSVPLSIIPLDQTATILAVFLLVMGGAILLGRFDKTPSEESEEPKRLGRKLGGWIVAAAVLLFVLYLYLDPVRARQTDSKKNNQPPGPTRGNGP